MAASRGVEWRAAAVAAPALALIVTGYRVAHVGNPTIVALTLLTVVLGVGAWATLRLAVATSIAAMLAFNFFFLPPVNTFTIADPQNWVVLFVFLAVAIVASNLSSRVRARAEEALARRDEIARLFDLTRDVLLTTDSRDALPTLARQIARRFDLDHVSLCLPDAQGDWRRYEGGALSLAIDDLDLKTAFSTVSRALEFDARQRTYGGQRVIDVAGHVVRLVPLRMGGRPIGLLAAAGRELEPGALDALAGLTAVAIERAQFLEDRRGAELTKQSEALTSALLASLAHDLRTPLTAIRLASANLQAEGFTDAERQAQRAIVQTEVSRLARLFDGILDMARIDAAAVTAKPEWSHPAEIVDAARAQVADILIGRDVRVDDEQVRMTYLDPKLTSTALARLLENAAAYSPAGSPIEISVTTPPEGLRISVRDHGPGLAIADVPHVFDRFFRGAASSGTTGTGMGLAIARGLLAAMGGRVWVENHPAGGAVFTFTIPATIRAVSLEPETAS